MIEKLRAWGIRLWGTFTNRSRGVDEELRFHLEMVEQEASRRGESVREARLRAGGLAQSSEAVRDQSMHTWLRDFGRDCRYGVRLLAKSPIFTVAAVLSLALGIGANTAIFSLIDALILRTMPVHEPGQLIQFSKVLGPNGRGSFSYPLFRRFADGLGSFDATTTRCWACRQVPAVRSTKRSTVIRVRWR